MALIDVYIDVLDTSSGGLPGGTDDQGCVMVSATGCLWSQRYLALCVAVSFHGMVSL